MAADLELQQKDIEFLDSRLDTLESKVDSGFEKIEKHLEEYAKNYLTKEEYKKDNHTLEERLKRIEVDIKAKVNHEDFAPFKRTLDKLNWLILSSLVLAVLGLIFVKAL